MSVILAIALICVLKDSAVKGEIKLIKKLFSKVSRRQAIIETGVLFGCLTVIAYGFGFVSLMVDR